MALRVGKPTSSASVIRQRCQQWRPLSLLGARRLPTVWPPPTPPCPPCRPVPLQFPLPYPGEHICLSRGGVELRLEGPAVRTRSNK